MAKKQPKVMVAVCHTRSGWEPEFVSAFSSLIWFDAYHQRRIPPPSAEQPEGGVMFCGGTNIASQRNRLVRAFLKSDCDWLLFVDTDEEFPPTLVEQLLASADEELRPIVSGLVMARRDPDKPISAACVVLDDNNRFVTPSFVPATRFWQVPAVGAGCLFVHRKVYEAIREKYAQHEPSEWFQYTPWTYTDDDGQEVKDEMGEDYTFSLRAQACGFPLFVDTTIELGHVKPVTLTSETFYRQNAQLGFLPTFVIIPVKDRLDLTQELIAQLREQAGHDGIILFDNGSGRETKQWLAEQPDLLVYEAPGAGIHEMWNAGIEEALRRSGGRCNLVFLNNDLKLGHNFIKGLVTPMREGDWVAVGPNYDNRAGQGVQQVRGICAERYDGTGGLPGFAFAARGEWFASGYRFPTEFKWWYGDNDLTMMLDMHGARYGIVPEVAVEHLGAGTAKNWSDPKWAKQLEADKQAWLDRWKKLGVELNIAS